MLEYEDSTSMAAAPDVVFDYVSDVGHLTDYIPNMVVAEPEEDWLRVAAEVQGRHEEGLARFHADANARRIEWSGEGSRRYEGWLLVSSADKGSSVTIHLTTDREEAADEIRRSLAEALDNIRRRVESLS